MTIESVASPPGEGSGSRIAALLRLTVDPITAISDEVVTVNITVMIGGNAIGKLC